MEELMKAFPYVTPRVFKGGWEFRVKNLDEAVTKAKKLIADKGLAIEIFDLCPEVTSFAVRSKS